MADFNSLQQVIQYYNTGVQDNPNLDPVLSNPQLLLGLNGLQINQLIAYLNTLTDDAFLSSSLFSDPFVNLPGDYTGNGVVDSADYDLWRANFGDTTSLVADGNGDQIVDTADYVLWRQNVGQTWQSLATGSGAGLTGNAVPEPAGWTLALMAIGWGLVRRQKR